MIQYCGIPKQVSGGGIRNGEGGGKFLTGDLVKTEVDMEVSAHLEMFCGKIWVMGKVGYLENNSYMIWVG